MSGERGTNIMRTIPKLGLMLTLAGTMCFGTTWRGARLIDAACSDQNGKVTHVSRQCAPTASTSTFAMKSRYSGKIYKLDEQSNLKAQQAFEAGAMKPDRNGAYRATVIGKREQGNLVDVSSIQHGNKSVH